jgi:hypothetical protein
MSEIIAAIAAWPDRVHVQDLDAVGLITPEVEAQLPEALRVRLREVRSAE